MKQDVKSILAASGGAFAAGAALKMTKGSDGNTNPIVSLGALGVGSYLALKGDNATMKALGYGLAAIGALGTAAKIAEKVNFMQKFTPSINGLGDLYEDENGNIIELGGLDGQPQLVQDENGQTYMVDGLNGDDFDDDDLDGLDGDDFYDDDLDGLNGDDFYEDDLDGLDGDDYELDELMGLDGDDFDDDDLDGLNGDGLEDLIAA